MKNYIYENIENIILIMIPVLLLVFLIYLFLSNGIHAVMESLAVIAISTIISFVFSRLK